jgi:hypothetical protein
VSGEIRQQLEDVADAQIKAKGRITRPTALLVGKPSSMHEAIELGKRIGSTVSAICASDLFVYAFDTMAHEVTTRANDLVDWERAFRGITVNGSTSCGVALKYRQRKKQYVEQIVMITDEEENIPPLFVTALREYSGALQASPQVVIVGTPGGCDLLEKQYRRRSSDIHTFGDSNLYLRRTSGHLVLSSKHRAAPASPPVYLELVSHDQQTTHLRVVGELGEEQRHGLQQQVLDLLSRGEWTRDKLRDQLSVKNERLGQALESLEQAGQIRRIQNTP